MMARKNNLFRVISATLIGHILWGFSFMASRRALDTAHVFLLLSHRFVLALAVMSLLLLTPWVRLHWRGKRLLPLIALGLAEPVIYFFGEQYGILHSSTIFSGVMIATIPLFSTLAAMPLLGEKPSWGQLAFSVLSIAGVVGVGLMSSSSGALDWIGVAALLVAVASAVAHVLLGRGISDRFTPFERTYMMLAVGAVVFTALALLHCRGSLRAYVQPLAEPGYLLAVLFLGVCCSVVAYFCSSYAITYLPVARATVFANLTTAVSVFAGAVFLHEPFTWQGLVCCLLILVGIYGVQRAAPREGGSGSSAIS